jgi:hypothetical protein
MDSDDLGMVMQLWFMVWGIVAHAIVLILGLKTLAGWLP